MVNRGQQIGLLGQGFQRQLGGEGEVLPLSEPSQQLLEGLGPQVSLFLSDVETDSWPNGTVEQLAGRSARLVVTQGEQGAVEYDQSGAARHIPAVQVGGGGGAAWACWGASMPLLGCTSTAAVLRRAVHHFSHIFIYLFIYCYICPAKICGRPCAVVLQRRAEPQRCTTHPA
jgi:hypothetical protein